MHRFLSSRAVFSGKKGRLSSTRTARGSLRSSRADHSLPTACAALCGCHKDGAGLSRDHCLAFTARIRVKGVIEERVNDETPGMRVRGSKQQTSCSTARRQLNTRVAPRDATGERDEGERDAEEHIRLLDCSWV